MTIEAAIERCKKLLALAAPTSGAEKPERESAALEAAKVIAEHNLTVVAVVTNNTPDDTDTSNHAAFYDSFYDFIRTWKERAAYEARKEYASAPPGFYASTKKTKRKSKQSSNWQSSNWQEVVIDRFCSCVVCGGPIFSGDKAFLDSNVGFRHYDITCDSLKVL